MKRKMMVQVTKQNIDLSIEITDLLLTERRHIKAYFMKQLPICIEGICDPDIENGSVERFVDNLFNDKLGDFDDRIVLLGTQNNELVGLLIALPTTNFSYNICSIAIKPEYRSMGYGTQMIKFLMNRLVGLKIPYLTLDVHEQNKKAISFYERLGFEIEKDNE